MPAVEAIASGTPVVCARAGSLPEVLGSAATWCEPLTARSLAEALRALLGSREHYRDVREAGLARARELPGWDVAAAVHLRAYREAMEA